MDEVDVRLCGLLIVNSRTPYRELAEKLGLSLQAVHRRIQVMQEQGVIRGFPGGLSFDYLGAVVVYIFGTSTARNMDGVVEALRKSNRTYIVLVCDRNYLSIGAVLRDHSEIEGYVDFARREASLTDLKVGLMSVTQMGQDRVGGADREKELSVLDYRIINALKDDARRPVEEVAAELGVSAATARRRLNRLMEIGAFTASLYWSPSSSGQIVAQLHVELKEGTDRAKVAGSLMAKHASRLLSFVTFGNLPTFILLVVWASSMRELGDLTSRAEAEEGVASVVTNVTMLENRFDTWVDRLVEERARAGGKASRTDGGVPSMPR